MTRLDRHADVEGVLEAGDEFGQGQPVCAGSPARHGCWRRSLPGPRPELARTSHTALKIPPNPLPWAAFYGAKRSNVELRDGPEPCPVRDPP